MDYKLFSNTLKQCLLALCDSGFDNSIYRTRQIYLKTNMFAFMRFGFAAINLSHVGIKVIKHYAFDFDSIKLREINIPDDSEKKELWFHFTKCLAILLEENECLSDLHKAHLLYSNVPPKTDFDEWMGWIDLKIGGDQSKYQNYKNILAAAG